MRWLLFYFWLRFSSRRSTHATSPVARNKQENRATARLGPFVTDKAETSLRVDMRGVAPQLELLRDAVPRQAGCPTGQRGMTISSLRRRESPHTCYVVQRAYCMAHGLGYMRKIARIAPPGPPSAVEATAATPTSDPGAAMSGLLMASFFFLGFFFSVTSDARSLTYRRDFGSNHKRSRVPACTCRSR